VTQLLLSRHYHILSPSEQQCNALLAK